MDVWKAAAHINFPPLAVQHKPAQYALLSTTREQLLFVRLDHMKEVLSLSSDAFAFACEFNNQTLSTKVIVPYLFLAQEHKSTILQTKVFWPYLLVVRRVDKGEEIITFIRLPEVTVTGEMAPRA